MELSAQLLSPEAPVLGLCTPRSPCVLAWFSSVYLTAISPRVSYLPPKDTRGFPGGSVVKTLPATAQETQVTRVQSLGREDPLEEEMASHSRTLAWRIPWTEEPGGLQSMGSQKSWTGLNTLTHIRTPINWIRAYPNNLIQLGHFFKDTIFKHSSPLKMGLGLEYMSSKGT